MAAMTGTNTGAWLVVIFAPLLFAASALLLRWGLRRPREKCFYRCPACDYDMRGHVPDAADDADDPDGLGDAVCVCPECGHDAKVLTNLVVENPSRAGAIVMGILGLCLTGPCIVSAVGWVLEQPYVRAIARDGGWVAYRTVPPLGVKWLGGDLLPTSARVWAVYFVAPNVPGNASLQGLTRLRRLRYVNVGGPAVTDAHVAGLAKLTNLTILALEGSQITDAGIATLKQLSGLRWLALTNTKVTGAGLAQFSALPQLRVLELTGAPVTDADLVHLKSLPQLVSINLSRTQVTDAGLVHLGDLSQLRYLDLSGTRITDAGLAHLDKLFRKPVNALPIYQSEIGFGAGTIVSLEQTGHLFTRTCLTLSATQVTDQGLAHLKHMQGLDALFLLNTQVTDAGIATLNESLPRLWAMREWIQVSRTNEALE